MPTPPPRVSDPLKRRSDERQTLEVEVVEPAGRRHGEGAGDPVERVAAVGHEHRDQRSSDHAEGEDLFRGGPGVCPTASGLATSVMKAGTAWARFTRSKYWSSKSLPEA